MKKSKKSSGQLKYFWSAFFALAEKNEMQPLIVRKIGESRGRGKRKKGKKLKNTYTGYKFI